MTPLEMKALEIAEEMRALGAVFEVEPGADGQPTFVWRARPPSLRDAVLTYWNSLEKPPGFREAMTNIIARHQLDRVGGLAL